MPSKEGRWGHCFFFWIRKKPAQTPSSKSVYERSSKERKTPVTRSSELYGSRETQRCWIYQRDDDGQLDHYRSTVYKDCRMEQRGAL